MRAALSPEYGLSLTSECLVASRDARETGRPMSADTEAVRAVMSWACGFLALAMIGVGIPLLLSFIPDSIHVWRREGEARLTLIFAGLATGVTVLAVYELTFTGTPGTPSTTLWLSLGLLLGVGVGIAAFCSTLTRALRRRREYRQAVHATFAPPAPRDTSTDGTVRPPGVQRLNARGAEFLARDWMRHLGATEAVVTPERRDGGVDVISREFVAQVKHIRGEQIGVAAIRQLYGVATAESRRALFFSSSGYTRDALAFARENDIALFVVRYQEGRLVPHGALAQHFLAQGLLPLHRV